MNKKYKKPCRSLIQNSIENYDDRLLRHFCNCLDRNLQCKVK
jgi:hypothetical protein